MPAIRLHVALRNGESEVAHTVFVDRDWDDDTDANQDYEVR